MCRVLQWHQGWRVQRECLSTSGARATSLQSRLTLRLREL